MVKDAESVVSDRGELRSAGLLALKLRDQKNIDLINNDPNVLNTLAQEAIDATDKVSEETQFRRAFESDRQVYRYTVWFLGATIVITVLGLLLISVLPLFTGKAEIKTPDALVAIAATAVGALAGLLSPIAIGARR